MLRFLDLKLHRYVVFVIKCPLPYFGRFSSPHILENHYLPHHVSKDHEANMVHPLLSEALQQYQVCPSRQHGSVKSRYDKSNKQTNLSHINRKLQKKIIGIASLIVLWENLMCLNMFNYGKSSNPITNRDEPYNTQNPCLSN